VRCELLLRHGTLGGPSFCGHSPKSRWDGLKVGVHGTRLTTTAYTSDPSESEVLR